MSRKDYIVVVEVGRGYTWRLEDVTRDENKKVLISSDI
jgi:hypothetical protein